MNFASNIRPDFSVPPPTINPINTGMGPRPNVASQNQFQQFSNGRPVPPYNANPPFPPFHFNPASQTSRPTFSGNSGYRANGSRGMNFSPAVNNYNGRGGVQHQTPGHLMHAREQICFDYNDVFGTAGNSVDNHSFPQSNPRPQQQGQQQIFPHAHTSSQPSQVSSGKDFRPVRGAFRGGPRRGGYHDRNFRHQNTNGRKQGQGTKKKKEKVDKRDLPENNVFFCDTCDRGFKNEDKYKEHIDGHIKCSYKDCPFMAAPKLVQLHMNMQHRGGLAKKIWSLESVEDIKKWRDDRKRNYPKAANIQRKCELRAEKLKRGEVLQTKDFSKMTRGGNRDSGRGRGRHRGRFNRGRHRRRGHFDHEAQEDKNCDNADDDDDDDGPPVVKKIHRSSRQENEEAVSKDQEKEEPKIEASKGSDNNGVGTQTLSLSLLSGYGSFTSDEDDSDDGAVQETSNVLPKENDSSRQTSSCEHEKPVTPGKNVLFQPFTRDKDAESFTPMPSQELQPSCNTGTRTTQNFSPQSKSSPENSPGTHNTDPFNLTGGDENSMTSDTQTNQKSSSPSENCQTGRDLPSSSSSHSVLGDNESLNGRKPVNGFPVDHNNDCVLQKDGDVSVDDTRIYPEMEKSHEKRPSPKTKSGVRSDLSDSTKQLSGRSEGKLKHFRSAPYDGHRDKERRRGESDTRKGRQEYRPQPKSYTLLEKLLAPQIRQERNKILQCIYYIVKHKFFD